MLANGAIAFETRKCRLVEPIAIEEKPFAYMGCRFVEVTGFEPVAPTLRT